MIRSERSFQSYMASLGFIKMTQAMLFAALIAFAVVMINVYATSKQIFESQLDAAINVYRMQILAGDLKRTQLVLKEILANGAPARIEFFDEIGGSLFPDMSPQSSSPSLSLRAEQPIFFDSGKQNLFGTVRAQQELRMNWFLFLTMFIALLLSQAIAGYFFSSALKEVSQDLTAKFKALRGQNADSVADITELSEIATSLNQMQKQLVEVRTTFKSPEEMRRFAHDLRSPMSAISLALGTIENLPAPARRLMDNAFTRMSTMTTSLLEKPTGAKVSMREALNSLIQEKISEHRSFDLRWELNLVGDVILTSDHAIDFVRSISNVLNNAAEASPMHGMVILRVRVEQDDIFIQVQDQGAGIPQELQAKVLRDGLSTKVKGHGIGLSSTYRLVKSWGGQVNFGRVPSGEFEVELQIPRKALA
ncbi:MAG: HAMP domain-containing histidine kinase [Bdellovibrionaceae bacterium]|nr:HAMP domain-containing histidine kinase [Pseudobdellovibrionaceae bacterium]